MFDKLKVLFQANASLDSQVNRLPVKTVGTPQGDAQSIEASKAHAAEVANDQAT